MKIQILTLFFNLIFFSCLFIFIIRLRLVSRENSNLVEFLLSESSFCLYFAFFLFLRLGSLLVLLTIINSEIVFSITALLLLYNVALSTLLFILFKVFNRFTGFLSFFILKYKNMKDFTFYVYVKKPYLISLILFIFSFVFIRLALENNILVFIPQVIILITLSALFIYYLTNFSKLIAFFILSFLKTKAYCSDSVSSNGACPGEAVNLLHGFVVLGDAARLADELPQGGIEAEDTFLTNLRTRVAVPASDSSSITAGIPSDLLLPESFYNGMSAGTKLLYGGLMSKYDPLLPVVQPHVQVYMLHHRHLYLGRPIYRARVEEEPLLDNPPIDGLILAEHNQQLPDLLPPLFRAIMAPVANNLEGIVFTPAGIRHFLNYLRGVHAEFIQERFSRVVDEPYLDFFRRYLNIIGNRVNVFEVNPDTLLVVFADIIKLIRSLQVIFRNNIYALRNEVIQGNMLQELWDEGMLHIERLMVNIDLVIVNPPVILFNDVLTLLLRFITRSDIIIIQNLGLYLHTYPVLLLFGLLMAFQSVLTPATFARALPIFVFNLPQVFDGLMAALQPARFNHRNFALMGNIMGQGFRQVLFLGIGIFTLLMLGQNITLPNLNINLLIDNRQWRIIVNPGPVEPAGEGVVNYAFKFIIKTFKKIVRIRIVRR